MEEQSRLAERILDQVADAVVCADRSTQERNAERPKGGG
jgi:hypothetical protein